MANQQDFAKYLVLIKKLVGYHIKKLDHQVFKEDLAHTVFMELYEENFFD